MVSKKEVTTELIESGNNLNIVSAEIAVTLIFEFNDNVIPLSRPFNALPRVRIF